MLKGLTVIMLLFSLKMVSQNKIDVYFDFNKDVPNQATFSKLNQWVSLNKEAEITKLFGYCDTVDDQNYNKDLATRRINTMIAFFKKNSIKIKDDVVLQSFGKDFKYSKEQSENRKVEVYYTSMEASPKVQHNNLDSGKAVEKVHPKKEDKFESEFITSTTIDSLVAIEKSALEVKFKKAKVGDLIRISNINFYFNSEKVIEQSYPLLDELVTIMKNNPTLRIEIHGHICCNLNPNDTKLSYRRALVILKHLTKNGIAVNRLGFKGFGSNNPIYRLPEKNERERAANRRVELLIVAKQ